MAEPIIIVKEGTIEVTIRVPGGGGCDPPEVRANGNEVFVRWPQEREFRIENGTTKRFKEVERRNDVDNKFVRIERA